MPPADLMKVDGFVSLLDGMHGGINPALLTETAYAKGINVSSRGGLIHTRPSFVRENIVLPAGVFQGAGVWSLESGDRLVAVISGRLVSILVDTLALVDHGVFFDAAAQCFFCQADRFLVIQDGVSTPQVLQDIGGVASVYAYPYDEAAGQIDPEAEVGSATYGVPLDKRIPVGNTMVFAHGRIHLASGPYFTSGDVLQPDYPASCLVFTETQYFNEGGSHTLPMEMGGIHGMAVMRNAATGTGVGSVIVAGRRGISGFDLSNPRTQWGSINLAQVLFFDAGTLSPWSFLSVNDDLVYRSQDGLRFLRYTSTRVAGGSGSLSNVPQSEEVAQFLALDAAGGYLPYVSTAAFGNLVFATCSGTGGRFFRGLISLDTAQVAAMTGEDAASYDGVWTGLDFAQVLTACRDGQPNTFLFTKTPSLYRLDSDVTNDYNGTAFVPIQARLETRVFNFESIDVKKLQFVELWLGDLVGNATLTVYYRPSGYPLWARAGQRVIQVASGSLPQTRRRLRIPIDSGVTFCDPVTQERLSSATSFQFAIEWSGHLQIEAFRAVVQVVGEATPSVCDEDVQAVLAVSETAGVVLDDFGYRVES